MFSSSEHVHCVSTSVPCQPYSKQMISERALTFCSEDHLSIYCSGDDWLWKVLQVPAQTVAQNWKLQLLQVS